MFFIQLLTDILCSFFHTRIRKRMTSLTSGMQQFANSRNVTEMAIDWRNRRLEHIRAENWRSDAGADCNTMILYTCTSLCMYNNSSWRACNNAAIYRVQQ